MSGTIGRSLRVAAGAAVDLAIGLKVSNITDNRSIDDHAGTQDVTNLPLYRTIAGRSVFLNREASLN